MKLDELEQLNQEILALSKAGVPLGQGLMEASTHHSLSRRLRRLTHDLGQRMEKGESIEEALGRGQDSLPPMYAAMLEVGAKTGNLTLVLESLTEHLRRTLELRRLTISSMTYPLVLVILCCLGFVAFLVPALHRISELLVTSRYDVPILQAWIHGLTSIAGWLRYVPTLLLAAITIWWVNSGRANQHSVMARWFGWLPGARRMLRAASRATFAHFLSILTRHQLPLDRAVTLAAAATGDPTIQGESEALSEALRQGNPQAAHEGRQAAIPGTMRWLLHSARSPQELQKGLERLAETYHREVCAREVWVKTVFPLVATVAVGGTATALYAFAIMGPWMTSLWHLSQP